MAVTAFTGEIYFLKGTPFTPDYTHSIYFSSLSAQQSYMQSKVDRTLTEQNYIKTESGKIRVQSQEEHIRDCNYMMWKTPVIGDSSPEPAYTWMYAFILGIDYVSNNVSEITYAIDVLQTYALFNVDFKECLVERLTPFNDTIGAHIEPESIGFSDYVLEKTSSLLVNTDFEYLVFSAFDLSVVTPSSSTTWDQVNVGYPQIVGGVLQGLYVYCFSTATECSNAIGGLRTGLAEGIIAVVNVPAGFITKQNDGRVTNATAPTKTEGVTNYVNIDGYTPKYNKLCTYPFNFLKISNLEGDGCDFRWEYFADRTNIHFKLVLSITPEPELIAIPLNYRGLDEDYDSRVTLTNFVHASWMSSYYSQWMHDKGIQGISAIIGGSFIAGMMGQSGTYSQLAPESRFVVPTGEKADYSWTKMAGLGAASLGSEMAKAQTHPNGFHGSSAGQSALASYHKKNIYCYQVCVNFRDAYRIDSYFSRYGYACCRIYKPFAFSIDGATYAFPANRNQMYIKTSGCIVTGNCAAEYCRLIEQIFDRGITWWKSASVVGDYN